MGERAISFDLDGTLVDFRFCDRVWLEEIPRLAASRWGCPQQEARRRVREAYREVGELRLEWYDMRYWFRRFGLPGDPGELLERCREAVRPYPEVPEVLRRLRAAGWQPVVISNAARPFMELELRQAGLWDLLEGAVSTTSDLGLVKADPRAYLEGCRLLGIEPGGLLHVGDHPEFDLRVPASLGIRAYLVDRGGRHDGHPRALRDLRELLWRLGEEERAERKGGQGWRGFA